MTRMKAITKVIPSDPEWDAAKAARRAINHADAVAESAYLTEQWRKMWGKSTSITVDVHEIIRTLNRKKIPFVLSGTQAIGGWTGRPRATLDVDILV